MRTKLLLGLLFSLAIFSFFSFSGIFQDSLISKQEEQQPSPISTNTMDVTPDSVCDKEIAKNPLDAVTIFEGQPAKVNFSNFPEAKTFYTVITTAVSRGANFAGHYTLARWGCGTSTTAYAVVDTITGNIIKYQQCLENIQLRTEDNMLESRLLVHDPVYKGSEREYYQLIEDQGKKPSLNLVCSEKSTKDMYSY